MDLGSSPVEGQQMQRLGGRGECLGLRGFVYSRDAKNAGTGEDGKAAFLCSHSEGQHDSLNSLEGWKEECYSLKLKQHFHISHYNG